MQALAFCALLGSMSCSADVVGTFPKLTSNASSLRTGACQYCYYTCCDNSGCCPLGTTCGTGSDANKCVGSQVCSASSPNCSSSAREFPAWLAVLIVLIVCAIGVCGCIAKGNCPCPPGPQSGSSSPYYTYSTQASDGYAYSTQEQVYEKMPLE